MTQAIINPFAFGGAPPPAGPVRDTITGASATETNPHVLVFPTYEAGDVVAFFFRSQSSTTLTTPTGWTLIVGRSQTGDSRVLVRTMDGGEGASVDYVTSTARRAAWVGVSLGTVDTAASPYAIGEHAAGVDPPSESISWGATPETLVFAFANTRRTDNALTLPSGYDALLTSVTADADASTNHVRASVARRTINATSEDPPTFGLTGTTDNPHALTVAFRLAP